MDVQQVDDSRIPFDGRLDYCFSNQNKCFSLTLEELETLKLDCLEAFTCRSISDANEDYSTGSTYFIGADRSPRCFLEKVALAIFRFHTKDTVFDSKQSGAEWWTQVVDCRDDIGFHWDRDYGEISESSWTISCLRCFAKFARSISSIQCRKPNDRPTTFVGVEEDTGQHIYPHLATVTYLTDCGGPTIILNRSGTSHERESLSGLASEMVVSRPVVGKHIKFDGRLLHAAPSDLLEEIDDEDEESDDSESEEEEEGEQEEEEEEEEFSNSACSSHGEKEIARKPNPDHKVASSETIPESESDSDESTADTDADHPKRVTFLVNIWLNHVPTQSEEFPETRLKNMKSILNSSTLLDTNPHTSSTSPCQLPSSAHAVDSRIQLTDSEHLEVPTISNNSKCNLPGDVLHELEQVEFSENKSWKFTNGNKKYAVTIPLPSAKHLNFLLDKYNAFRISYDLDGLAAKIETVSSKKRKTNSVPVLTIGNEAVIGKKK